MKIGKQLNKSAPVIFSAFGILGFATAVLMSARATPAAQEELEYVPEEASFLDKVKVLTPIYAPTVGMMLLSSACIVNANRIHNYRYASLLALYTIGEQQLKKWQDVTLDTVGKKKYEEIRETSVAPPKEVEPPTAILLDDERVLFYDYFSGRPFRMDSVETVRRIVNDMNERLYNGDWVSINEFYADIGLERLEFGDEWGWYAYDGNIGIQFDTFLRNDRPVVGISFTIKPKEYD